MITLDNSEDLKKVATCLPITLTFTGQF